MDVTTGHLDQPTTELPKTLAIPKYVGLVNGNLLLILFLEYPRNGDGLVICSLVLLRAKQSFSVLLLLQIPVA